MMVPPQLASLVDAAAPYMTPPVLAGSALALLLTLVAMALGFGRPAKKAAGRKTKAPAKAVASPKPAKAPAAAKSTPAKTKAPATPGTDVRRSARHAQHMRNLSPPRRLAQRSSADRGSLA
jgi:hypothetical protein